MMAVLEKTDWRIAGRGGAAEVLGLKRTTLQAKMNKLEERGFWRLKSKEREAYEPNR
jgi:transcriptional regulator with GAF, ATPase, and Fis domain